MTVRDLYQSDKISHRLNRFSQIPLILSIKSVLICEISGKKKDLVRIKDNHITKYLIKEI
jgi:hypothetical protein